MTPREEALAIARKNASLSYRDLSVYEIEIKLESGKWYVDYEFRDKNVDGGGPHYVISQATGEIITFRFEQ